MSSTDLAEQLAALRLSPADAADHLGVSERSVHRWLAGETVPGPVEAALRAWKRLDDLKQPWRPKTMLAPDYALAQVLKEIAARGGPREVWSVDLAKSTATFDRAAVSFYRTPEGGFSPSTYHRRDREPSVDDTLDIQDAVYWIDRAVSRAQTTSVALLKVADYARKHPSAFAWDKQRPDRAELDRRQGVLKGLADQLEQLADIALKGMATYQEFEAVLAAMHGVGFFPTTALVSEVARCMVEGAAPARKSGSPKIRLI